MFIFIFDKYGKGKFSVQLEIRFKEKVNGKSKFRLGFPYRQKMFNKNHYFSSELNLVERFNGLSNASKANVEAKSLLSLLPEIEKWWQLPESAKNINTQTTEY